MSRLHLRTSALTLCVCCMSLMLAAAGCKKSAETEDKEPAKKAETEKKAEEPKKPKVDKLDTSAEAPAPAPVMDQAQVSTVLAKVGAIEITSEMLEKELARNGTPANLTKEQVEMRRKAVLKMLVNDALIRVASEKEGIVVTTEEVDAERAKWVQESGGEEAFVKSLERRKMTDEQAREVLRSTLLSKKLVLKRKPVDVSDETLKAEYDKEKGSAKRGPQVKISEIFFPVVETAVPAMWDETAAQAEKVLAEIKAGLSFAEAAKKYSKGPTAKRGGAQGAWAGMKRLPKELFAPAFEKNVGDVYGPVKTKKGIYLAKVDEKRNSSLGDFEVEKVNMRAAMEKRQYDTNLKAVLEELEKELQVTYTEK